MWGHHSWSLQGMGAAFKEIFSWCMTMENIRCDVDENLIFGLTNKSDRMSTKNNFFSWMLFGIFVYLWQHKKYKMYNNWTSKISLYMKCNCTKINVLYKYKCLYTFFFFFSMYYWLFSSNISSFIFYKTLISMVYCHGEKKLWRRQKYFIFWWPLAKLLTQ